MTEKGIYSKYQQLEKKSIWFKLYQLWCCQIHFLNIFILKRFSELFSSAKGVKVNHPHEFSFLALTEGCTAVSYSSITILFNYHIKFNFELTYGI